MSYFENNKLLHLVTGKKGILLKKSIKYQIWEAEEARLFVCASYNQIQSRYDVSWTILAACGLMHLCANK